MVSVKVLVAIFFAVSLVGIAVSLVVVDSVLSQRLRDEQIETNRFGRAVARQIFLELTSAVEAASLVSGTVHGMVPNLPAAPDSANFTVPTPVMQRAWFELSTPLVGLRQVALYPADVEAQRYPDAVATPLVDASQVSSVVVSHLRNSSDTRAVGPLTARDGTKMIAVVAPVYNRTVSANCTATPANGSCVAGTYWGHSRSFHSIAALIGDVSGLPAADGHDFIVCARDIETGELSRVINWTRPSDGSLTVDHSGGHDTDHYIGVTILSGADARAREWVVGTHRRDGFTQSDDSRAYAGAILASIAAGFVTVIFVVIGIIVFKRATQRDASGPLQGPLAILVLEIDDTSAPWAVAPAAASETINGMMAACRREAARCNAYAAQLVGDGMLIVATKPSDALEFASAMHEWAAANDWPEVVRLQRAKVRPLRLRMALHWGRDVVNRTPAEEHPEYAGADADYAVGMRSMCPCGRVTVTPAFRSAAVRGGIPKDTFVPLGTTLPTDDGIVYGGYVVRSRRDGAGLDSSSLTIDDEDRCLWNESADPEPTLALTSTISQEMNVLDQSNIVGGGGDPNAPGDDFDPVHGGGRPPAPPPQARASARGVAASKQRQIEAALNHPAFTKFEHAPWLPARACEVQDVQKLHSILQDHITTPDEATHYSALLTVATYNFQAFSFMLGPLAAVERNNVARRLQSAFGIPERGFLQRLAVHTAIVSFRALPMPPALLAQQPGFEPADENATINGMNMSAQLGMPMEMGSHSANIPHGRHTSPQHALQSHQGPHLGVPGHRPPPAVQQQASQQPSQQQLHQWQQQQQQVHLQQHQQQHYHQPPQQQQQHQMHLQQQQGSQPSERSSRRASSNNAEGLAGPAVGVPSQEGSESDYEPAAEQQQEPAQAAARFTSLDM